MQQLCATLLALARDHSPFNAYYSARLCERVQRLLLQLLRSLAQESAPSLALPVLDTLLLVLSATTRARSTATGSVDAFALDHSQTPQRSIARCGDCAGRPAGPWRPCGG